MPKPVNVTYKDDSVLFIREPQTDFEHLVASLDPENEMFVVEELPAGTDPKFIGDHARELGKVHNASR